MGGREVFSRVEAVAAGISDRDLRDGVAQGSIRRVSRGIYVAGEPPTTRTDELVERARALSTLHEGRLAISHHCALAVLGVALHEVPLHLVYAVRVSGGFHSKAGLVICRPRRVPPTRDIVGLTVVEPAVAVLQVAAAFGLRAGVVAADSARHLGLVSVTDLQEELHRVGRVPGIHAARRAVQRCAPGAESPGESLLRLVAEDAGFTVTTQFPIFEGRGAPFAYADLRLEGTRHLLEFDGAVKYAGIDGRAALVAEKHREDRIRRLGWTLDRVVWSDFNNLAALRRRLRERLPSVSAS